MKSETLQDFLEQLGAFLLKTEGKLVEISETISLDRARELDPHVTLHNLFCFKVRKSGWQMSGGHIYLYGESEQHGIFTKALEAVEIQADHILVLEQFETKTVRRSRIKLTPETP